MIRRIAAALAICGIAVALSVGSCDGSMHKQPPPTVNVHKP